MEAGTGIRFTVNGQESAVDKVGMADMVAFERQFGLSAAALTPDIDPITGEPDPRSVRIEWIAFMVWRSARRQGLIPKETPFDDDFLEGIDDVDLGGDEPEGPQTPAQSQG